MRRRTSVAAALTIMGNVALMAPPAFAHHPTGGKLPATLWHGLLSGLGHPVIGPDHLAFLLAFGAVAALIPAGWRACVAFVAASMAGVVVHLAKLTASYPADYWASSSRPRRGSSYS